MFCGLDLYFSIYAKLQYILWRQNIQIITETSQESQQLAMWRKIATANTKAVGTSGSRWVVMGRCYDALYIYKGLVLDTITKNWPNYRLCCTICIVVIPSICCYRKVKPWGTFSASSYTLFFDKRENMLQNMQLAIMVNFLNNFDVFPLLTLCILTVTIKILHFDSYKTTSARIKVK